MTTTTGPAAPAWHGTGLTATLRREFLLLTRNRTNLLLAIVPTAVYITLFATSLTDLIGTVTYRGQQIGYADFAVPALMFSSLLAAATTSGTALFQERMSGMSLELWSYPLTRGQYVLGKLLAGSALVLAQTLSALAVTALLFQGRWAADRWFALLCGALVAACAFNGLYLLLATLVQDFQRFTVLINVLAPVLLFASPSFYPIDAMGTPQRWLAAINPVTYGVTALREALLYGFASALPYLLLLAGAALVSIALVGRSLARQARGL
ncbi:ABC transporter permease [Micromonospora sp. C51]|uniref:ABC transporter permease n=1 Tax=Micromonospora sp. C51 TaxID=2824879 RepID=UPI001B3774D7|nr:ABC transporter permease [Micromonospora sp. C51]MBQ1050597.1 ABC transporter permease [Micromonospora sp. C51]